MVPHAYRRRRFRLGLLLALGALGLELVSTLRGAPASTVLHGMALYLGLLGVLCLSRARARLHHRRALPLPALVALLLLLGAAYLMSPALVAGGGTIMAWDAPMHAWHANNLANLHWPSLRGYTFGLLFGWPEGDDYPLFVYLPAVLLHKMSFGALSIDTAVAIEMIGAAVAWPFAFWLWFRREVGPWAALAGAVVVLWDPGAFHQTGSFPLVVAGMWTYRLCISLCVMTMWASHEYLLRGERRWMWALLVLGVLSCQVHVGGFTFLGFAAGCLVLAGGCSGAPIRRVGRWFVAVVGTMLTFGWFLLPWYAQRDLYLGMAEGGATTPARLLEHVLALRLFDRVHPVELAVSLGGAAWLAARRPMVGRFALAASFLGVVLVTKEVMTSLAPESLRKLFETLIYPRNQSFGRSAVLFCMGFVIIAGVRWWWRHGVRVRPKWDAVLVAALVAGTALLAWREGYPKLWADSHLRRTRAVPAISDAAHAQGMIDAAKWVGANAPADSLLVVDAPISHTGATAHLAGHVQMHAGVPVVSARELAAVAFVNYVKGRDNYAPGELRAGGATHWVQKDPRPKVPYMTEVGVFAGDVHLFEMPRLLDDQRISGDGDVKIERMDSSGVVLTGTPNGFAANLRMRWTPRLRAVESGGVEIRPSEFLPGSPPIFTRVVVPPGMARVTLELGPPPRSSRGWMWTLAGIAIVLASAGLVSSAARLLLRRVRR